jgi:voltage-gated potassium channel
MPASRRRSLLVLLRYAVVMIHQFRWTLGALAAVMGVGSVIYGSAPAAAFASPRPQYAGWPVVSAWLDLMGQPTLQPAVWYLAAIQAIYPLLGFALVGEGIVRFGMLMFSRQRGEREWTRVMASTYRDHVIVCGFGHLGFRIVGQLLERGEAVVVIERDANCPFLGWAREHRVPVLLQDMRDDQSLQDAGIAHARAIVIASDDDLANIEVALDSRRLNSQVRVVLRFFDQRIADKFKDAGFIDDAFSSAALAAPAVATLAMRRSA